VLPPALQSFTLTLKIVRGTGDTNTSARFDIGYQIAIDGDLDAKSGNCYDLTLNPNDPQLPGGDGDACGDIVGDLDGSGGDEIRIVNVPVQLLCEDLDGDGHVDFPYCSSWKVSGSNTDCQNPQQAIAIPASKCWCDVLNLPVIIPATVTVQLVTQNAAGTPIFVDTDFLFSSSGTGSSTFILDTATGGAVSNTIDFTNLAVGSSVTINGPTPPPSTFCFISAVCTSTKSGFTSTTTDDIRTFTLRSAEHVTCVYTYKQSVTTYTISAVAPQYQPCAAGSTPTPNSLFFSAGLTLNFQLPTCGRAALTIARWDYVQGTTTTSCLPSPISSPTTATTLTCAPTTFSTNAGNDVTAHITVQDAAGNFVAKADGSLPLNDRQIVLSVPTPATDPTWPTTL
jgi:hypothetical protein